MSKWLTGFTLFAVLGFASLIYVLDRHEQGKTPPSLLSNLDLDLELTSPSSDSAKQTEGAVEQEQPGSSGFDFYKLLPKMEVSLPDGKASGSGVKNTTERQQTVDNAGAAQVQDTTNSASLKPQVLAPVSSRFILQAGSFKDYREADKRRAGLALLGVESRIQRVVLDNAQVWHRVRVGPFGNRQEVNRIRDRLKTNHIETILLREVVKAKS